jgi:CRP-like cAMP-binding protein
MYLKQTDLFRGISMHFLTKVMAMTRRESYPEGTVLFRSADPADYFYVLIKGRVKLSTGETDKQVHIGSRTGEAFGWSALVERTSYTASARCLEPTDLLEINASDFKHLLAEYIDDGFVFYRNLSVMMGERLVKSYRALPEPDADQA